MLLVLVAAGSYWLNSDQVYQDVTNFIRNAIPVPAEVVDENLQQVLKTRGTVGAVGLVTLLWSASSFFSGLAYNVNLAWPEAPRRNFLEKRIVGLGMIAVLTGLLVLSLAFGWMTDLLPFLDGRVASPPPSSLWKWVSSLGSWLMLFLLFLALYRWVPAVKAKWNAIIIGALSASITWKLAAAGFNLYLGSGLDRFTLVYGSLGAIVALLFLIFIVSLIALFGAHLCAAIDRNA